MALILHRAHTALVFVAWVAVLFVVVPAASVPLTGRDGGRIPNTNLNDRLVPLPEATDHTEIPNLFQQAATIVGNMLGTLFSGLNAHMDRAATGEGPPLVAVDTGDAGPTVHIPGIFSLNTGDTRRPDGSSSLVSVSTVGENTKVTIPGVFNLDVGGRGPYEVPRNPSIVSVSTNRQGTRVIAPFVDVGVDHKNGNIFTLNNTIHIPSPVVRNKSAQFSSVAPNPTTTVKDFSTTSHNQFISESLFPSATQGRNPFLTTARTVQFPTNQVITSSINQNYAVKAQSTIFSETTATSPKTPNPLGFLGTFSEGLQGYKSHRINHRLVPNYLRHMNPSPNDIPDYLMYRGIDTPYKVRTHIIDTAEKWIHRAMMIAGIND